MDSKNKSFIRMKVNLRVSELFTNIISDIPYPYFKSGGTTLISYKKNTLILYEEFYDIVYRCVLEYVPKESENPLVKAIKQLPRAFKNVKRIQENKKIIEFQQSILDKYFYTHGEMNIRDKIDELKLQVEELIEQGELEYLDSILERFEERMRSDFLNDMKILSHLLEKR